QPRHAAVAAAAGPNEFASFQPARGWLGPIAAASTAARRDCGAGPAVGSAPATGCVDALSAARGAAARSRVATQCSATGKYIAAAHHKSDFGILWSRQDHRTDYFIRCLDQ